jgi:hypothetical protein
MLFREVFKQMTKCQSLLLKGTWILSVILVTASCGKKVNSSQDHKLAEGVINQLTIEKNCLETPLRYEKETLEVFSYYNELLMREPTLLGYISPRNYDFLDPLIIKPEFFLQKLAEIKKNNSLFRSSAERQSLVIDELFYLEQSARRFEFAKCKFPLMTRKYVEDPRPYLKLGLACLNKDGGSKNFCSLDELKAMDKAELSMLVKKTIPLCVALTKNIVACRSELYMKKEQGKEAEFVNFYQEKYRTDKYNKFYLLAENNRKFSCQNLEGFVEMAVKIFAPKLDSFQFQLVRDSLIQHWASEKFKLSIERIEVDQSDAVKIYLTDKLVSHVTSRYPNTIFLAVSQFQLNQSKVIAHEFGHILGFPDCYSEIFDQKKNELVYFEHKKNEYNLMCTIKNFARVPSTYIEQLVERSCVFK